MSHPEAEYSSHMAVLAEALEHFKPKSIMEIGCGLYSTPMFFEAVHTGGAERLLVVEQSDVKWLDDIKEQLGEMDGVEYDFLETSVEAFDKYGGGWDMVFVDGEASQRRHAVQLALNNDVPVVIFHDSEKVTWYGYDRIVKPDHYYHRHYQSVIPEAHGKSTCVISDTSVLLEPALHRAVLFGKNRPEMTVELP